MGPRQAFHSPPAQQQFRACLSKSSTSIFRITCALAFFTKVMRYRHAFVVPLTFCSDCALETLSGP